MSNRRNNLSRGNTGVSMSNSINLGLNESFRKTTQNPVEHPPKPHELAIRLGKDNNDMNDMLILTELKDREIQRKRYEEILNNKKVSAINGVNTDNGNSVKGDQLSYDLQTSLLELVNASNTTNSILSNVSSSLGVSQKNANNISNVNSGHKDFVFEFDSKYRSRNLAANLDPNKYFVFYLSNVKTPDNIVLGNIGVGYPLENIIEMEINTLTIPNILKDYDETVRKKNINLQIVELIDKNVIETSSISEWKDKHFIFEIKQYVEYNSSNQLIINDNYLKLVPIVNKIRFPSPVAKLDKLTFIFSLEDIPLVFANDLIIGDLNIGPLNRTTIHTYTGHNLTTNDLLVISDNRTSNDFVNLYPELLLSSNIIDPNLNNNLVLNNQFPLVQDAKPDLNPDQDYSTIPINNYFYNKSNISLIQPDYSSVFKINGIADYANLMLYNFNNLSKNMTERGYKMMKNNISDYLKYVINNLNEYKISNILDENNFNILINSYSYFEYLDNNDLQYMATLKNIENIITTIDALNKTNNDIYKEINIVNASLAEDEYILTKNNISLFNINKELYSYNDNQTITITVTVVSQIINNTLTYNYYFDGILVSEYILYNNNTYIFDQSDTSNLNYTLKFSTSKPTNVGNNQVGYSLYNYNQLGVNNPIYNGLAGTTNGSTILKLSNVLVSPGTILYSFSNNLPYSGLEIKLTIQEPILPSYIDILKTDILDTYSSSPLPAEVQNAYPNETDNNSTLTYGDYIRNIYYLEQYINNQDTNAIEAATNSLATAKQNTDSATSTLSNFQLQWGLVSNLYNTATMNIKNLNMKRLDLFLLKYQISYLQLENSSISEDNDIILYVTVQNNKYFINGNDISNINLYTGNTYKFDLSDSSNLGNGSGFIFSQSHDGVSYNTNVTYHGTLGTAGSYVKILITSLTPSTLYYCSNLYNNMGDVLYIKNTAITELSGNINNITVSNQDYIEMWNNIILDTARNKFIVTVENNSFYINNIKSSSFVLNLMTGNTYTFDLSDISNTNFVLCDSSEGNIYNTNVTILNNNLILVVNDSTPSVLYYKNVNSANYGGQIKIYKNDGSNVFSQIAKKNLLTLFKNYYNYMINNITNTLKKDELILKNDKDILEKTKELNKIKSIIINNYKANDSGFNISIYNPSIDILNIKTYINNLQNNLPNDLSSYSVIMSNYEKAKNELIVLLEDLGNRKYNIMKNNNTFIWSENYNGTIKNLASSLREGNYTIYEIMSEIEYILNKDSPFGYIYKVNIDYNNLVSGNNLNKCVINCKLPENLIDNIVNGFQIRYDLNNLYDLLFSTFNISFQNSPFSDYSYYNNLLPLTNGNTIKVINTNNIIKRPIQIGDSRKIFTIYTEFNTSNGQDIIGLLKEYNPSTNQYVSLTRTKLGTITDQNDKHIYLCKLFYDSSIDNNIYYSLVCIENIIYLVSINSITNNVYLIETYTNLYSFSSTSIDKNYEPVAIRDKNVSNNKKIVIFYDITNKIFKSLVIDLTLNANRVYLGNNLLITTSLTYTTIVGSNPLMTTNLSSTDILEVSGVLKMDDYQQIWSLTILEGNTTYSTIMCNINYNTNNIICTVSSYISNYSGVNDTTAFFVYNNNTFIWIGKSYYIRNVNNVFSNKKIKVHILTLASNQIILNYSDNTLLNEINDQIDDSFVLDVINGKKLENTNKFYLIHSNYYYNSQLDYNKKITLSLYNVDNITYQINVEKSFEITDTDNTQDSIYHYLFGLNSNHNNAYFYPQVLYYFPDYNIYNWYYVNNYENANYKNYLSFIMIDNLISNAKDSDFTLNKNYLGETEFHNISSSLSLNYISSNNIFDLLYNTNINYNSYITNLSNYYETLQNLKTFNDNINYYNEKLKTLNDYINLKDYVENYSRSNNISYSSIENLITNLSNYYDNINNYSQNLYLISSNIELLDEYTKNINDNVTLINTWEDEIKKYILKLDNNKNMINLKNLEINTGNSFLNSSQNDITIDNLIAYYKNYINGGKDDNNTDFIGYTQQLRALNGQIDTYINYLNPSSSNTSSLLTSFTATLNQAQATYNNHNNLLTEYKTNLNILLKQIYNSSSNINYKNAAILYVSNYENYTNYVTSKVQSLSIINNLKSKITTAKNQIASNNYTLAKNKLDLINNNKFLIDLNYEIFTKLLTKWLKSGGNDNLFNRIYIQNLTIPEIPFYISNRRFQITLRLRILNEHATQGILNV